MAVAIGLGTANKKGYATIKGKVLFDVLNYRLKSERAIF